MKFKSTAYVVIVMSLSPATKIPVFKSVRIYSESARNLTIMCQGDIATDLFSVDGDSYQEAHTNAVNHIKAHSWLHWLLPHVAPIKEQHNARFDQERAVKACIAATDAVYSVSETGRMLETWNKKE